MYTVDTLLYSSCFTNCIIPFLLQLLYYSQVFTWVLQPELLLKVITITVNNWWHTILGYIVIASSKQILHSQSFSSNLLTIHISLNVANTWPFQVLRCSQLFLFSNIVKRSHKKNYAPLIVTQNISFNYLGPLSWMSWLGFSILGIMLRKLLVGKAQTIIMCRVVVKPSSQLSLLYILPS